MSNKAQKRKYYYHRRSKWLDREPPKWRIFKWLRWKREKPVAPNWLKEWEKQHLTPWEF